MQNKPNVKDAQINVNSYMKSKYEKLDTWLSGKNKPNSNPIKPNLPKAKMNVNLYVIEDYRKKDDFVVRINKPKTNPILSAVGGLQMSVNIYCTEDYENKWLPRVRKNKPNTNPIQTQSKPVLSAVEWAKFRTLFPLKARPFKRKTLSSNGARGYNKTFSQMSFFQRTPNERV